MRQLNPKDASTRLKRSLYQIFDLPYLSEIYGHDLPAITKKISMPIDSKTLDEVISQRGFVSKIPDTNYQFILTRK